MQYSEKKNIKNSYSAKLILLKCYVYYALKPIYETPMRSHEGLTHSKRLHHKIAHSI